MSKSNAEEATEQDRLHLVPARPSEHDEEFNWSMKNADVIIPEQVTTAVYVNPWGQAVIRQKAAWDAEEDPYVVIDHANLPELIRALRVIADAPVQRDEIPERNLHPVKRID